MRYYVIAGEASGDLHASVLMRALKERDDKAVFRFIGGGKMAEVAGSENQVADYRDLAFMGFIPVLLHLGTILSHMDSCKKDIEVWRPDALILVDYPGFNLKIAKHVHKLGSIPVFYYISPKIWAWKEWRIKQIKRDVDHMLCILPFEKAFFEKKHGYPIEYVGNPTADEVHAFLRDYHLTREEFCAANGLNGKPMVALLAGSRRQEIKDNLPVMLRVASRFPAYQFVLAGAPGLDPEVYRPYLQSQEDADVRILYGKTYEILCHSRAALVTSGTATLETALFGVPQAVCYYFKLGPVIRQLKKLILSIRHISLVNLVADREVVRELIGDLMNEDNLSRELSLLLEDTSYRDTMLRGYDDVRSRLGENVAPERASELILKFLA